MVKGTLQGDTAKNTSPTSSNSGATISFPRGADDSISQPTQRLIANVNKFKAVWPRNQKLPSFTEPQHIGYSSIPDTTEQNTWATGSLAHKAEVSRRRRGKAGKSSGSSPTELEHHHQEVSHCLPTAAKPWLREFAQGERQAIGRELWSSSQEKWLYLATVCKSSTLRAFLKTVNFGGKHVRGS